MNRNFIKFFAVSALALLMNILIGDSTEVFAQRLIAPGKQTCFISKDGSYSGAPYNLGPSNVWQVIDKDGYRGGTRCIPEPVVQKAKLGCTELVYVGKMWLNRTVDGSYDPSSDTIYLAGFPDEQYVDTYLSRASCDSDDQRDWPHVVGGIRMTNTDVGYALWDQQVPNAYDVDWEANGRWTPYAYGNRYVDSKNGDVPFLKIVRSQAALDDYARINIFESTQVANYCANYATNGTFCRINFDQLPRTSLISIDKRQLPEPCKKNDSCEVEASLMFFAWGSYPIYDDRIKLKIQNNLASSRASVKSLVKNKTSATAVPGETVTFNHSLIYTTRGGIKDNINLTFSGDGVTSAQNSKTINVDTAIGSGVVTKTLSFPETLVVTPGQIGKTFCRTITWKSATGATTIETNGSNSAKSCVTIHAVPYTVYTNTYTYINGVKQPYNNHASYNAYAKPGDKLEFSHAVQGDKDIADLVDIQAFSWVGGISPENVLYEDKNNIVSKRVSQINLNAKPNPLGYTHPQVSPLSQIVKGVTPNPSLVNEAGIIQAAAGGKQICQRVWVTPKSAGSGYTPVGQFSRIPTGRAWACVHVPYFYTLTPRVKIDGSSDNLIGTPGETKNIVGVIEKGSDHTWSRPNSQWQLVQFLVPSGGALKSGADNAVTPCSYFGGDCSVLQSKTGKTFTENIEEVIKGEAGKITIPNLPVGTKICFALSVQPFSHSSDNWRHSNPYCIIISKAPKTQVHGSSLILPKGSAKASSTTISSGSPITFGSWIEYDILARNSISPSGPASGAGYPILASDPFIKRHQLSFANLKASSAVTDKLGRYYTADQPSMADAMLNYHKSAPATTLSSTSFDLNTINGNPSAANGQIAYYKHESGHLTITNSAQLNTGSSAVVIKRNGNLIIDSNLVYQTTGVTNMSHFPQLILIVENGDIIINSHVTQVDAWLIARDTDKVTNTPAKDKGHLRTCNIGIDPASGKPNSSALSSKVCNQPLTINGPVVVDYLDLYRTYGSEIAPTNTMAEPAELFNFRPDAYLWGYSHTPAQQLILETTYSRELPVRY